MNERQKEKKSEGVLTESVMCSRVKICSPLGKLRTLKYITLVLICLFSALDFIADVSSLRKHIPEEKNSISKNINTCQNRICQKNLSNHVYIQTAIYF